MISCKNKILKIKAIKVDVPKTESGVKFYFEKRIKLKSINNIISSYDKGVIIQFYHGMKEQIIRMYDKDLNFLKEHKFRIGQGPGELGGASHFIFCNNRWYVFDKFQLRISIFDRDFRYIGMIKEKRIYPFPLVVENCKRIIAEDSRYIGNTKTQSRICYSDFPKQKIKTVFYRPKITDFKNGKMYFAVTSFILIYHQGKIYYFNPSDYTISIINLKGEVIKGIRVNFKKIRTPKEKIDAWVHEYLKQPRVKISFPDYIYPIGGVIKLNKGFVVIRRKGYNKQCYSINGYAEGDYFDYELNPKGKVNVPCFETIYCALLTSVYWGRYKFVLKKSSFYIIKSDEDKEKTYLEKWRIKE